MRPTVGIALTATLMMLVACSASSSPSAGDQLPPYITDILNRGTSESQYAILMDGVVSPSEYESAVLAALRCIEEHGIPHSDPVFQTFGARAPKWRYTVGPWPVEHELDTVNLQCYTEYEVDVQFAWSIQEGPTEDEQEAIRDAVVQCASERGVKSANYSALIAALASLSNQDSLIVNECIRLGFNGELPSSR